ncbi:MAG: hypothetical protein AB9Q22_08050 [Candidatus Reddybacter sp.]
MNLSTLLKTNLTNTNLEDLFTFETPDPGTVRRHEINTRSFCNLVDNLSDSVCCLFIRSNNCTTDQDYQFTLQGAYQITAIPAGGWLIQDPNQQQAATYWIPALPKNRQLDDDQHITSETSAPIGGLEISTEALSITVNRKQGYYLDLVILRFMPDADNLVQQLIAPQQHELAPVFLWGSHTTYCKHADLFLHLINGLVYENRTAWPYYRKICSENDAHALYVTLTGLQHRSGKLLYVLLKRLLVSATLSRQGEDGAWRHGEWSDDMEAHFRLHCSGMHLLMDVLSERHDPEVEANLKSAAAYIAKQHDSTNIGTWFLHDELELSEASMSKSPFKWVKSRAFGKRPSNMLVLNTHLDTSIALDRYATLTGDSQYATLLASARQATRTLLTAKPAERLYRIIFNIIELTLLPTEQAKQLPVHLRIFKRLGWKYLIPRLQHIKKIFPRIVMPGGYIDRALSLRGISPAYQSINTMDLARYIRRFPDDIPLDQIRSALEFSQSQIFRDFLAESKKTRYALGFWAETLYHLCTIDTDPKYRQWLTDVLLDLDNNDLGIPPSILGGNMEALSAPLPPIQAQLTSSSVLVANLSLSSKTEFLLVNRGAAPATIALKEFSLLIANKISPTQGRDITLNPGDWVTLQPVRP